MKEQKDNLSDIAKVFFAEKITREESEELAEMSHAKLLGEAFEALSKELDTQGNTAKFQELRKEHSLKLIKFWKNKVGVYQKAQKEGLVKVGDSYSHRDETISVVVCGVYEDDNSVFLDIKRHTKTENDEVQMTIRKTGIDEFGWPPTIKSEVKLDPKEAPDIYYKVTLRKGIISTFERNLYRTDPNHQRPFIKDTRNITC
ncbi:hypothetical protein MUP35_04190 [Patescibacteria group bacterium]|nr:hypothetical protein [Patescibacteria group bacterium]